MPWTRPAYMRRFLKMPRDEILFCGSMKSPECLALKNCEALGAAPLCISWVRVFSGLSTNSFRYSISLVTRPSQSHAGPLPCMIPPVDYDAPVHQNVVDPRGILLRTRKCSCVGDPIGIENDNVSPVSLPQQPTIFQPEPLRGKRSHPPHRILQRQHLLIAHVVPQDPRKRSKVSRMGMPCGEHSLNGER